MAIIMFFAEKLRQGLPVCLAAIAVGWIGGLAAVASAAEPGAFDPARLEVTVLASELQRPIELAVAGDGRVYFIELDGKLKRIDPRTEKVETLAELKVAIENENGLIGLALDPRFDENHWLYLQYSPPDYAGQHISRFTLAGDKLDLASEKLLFKFEEQRKECCHHAGSMTFGPDGCLYIGTGDNTHPVGKSDSYAPLDERPGKEAYDSQRTAANSRSGSGKILRIRPTPQGGYEIPDGNLFPKDGSQGLPEIYAMGCRNPWRISVDAKTGFLYWGDVGPDAGGDGPRGPRGYDEINQARAAGNFGWPYFIANNRAYHDVDFTTGKVGAAFDAEAPVNDSPNNTGVRQLPKPQPALLYYPTGPSATFPQLNGGGGRTACAGPVYHYDASLASARKFPEHFDRVLFIYEWTRHWIKAVHLSDDGAVERIEPFMPWHRFVRPADMQFGPDGALYLIEYGETWGVNKDARLVRIDYVAGNRRPIAKASVTNNVGREPLEVTFSSEGSFDKDAGDKLTYEWLAHRADRPGEPTRLSQEANPKWTFREPGIFNVELVVTDSQGAASSATVPVMVGNARPTVRLLHPADGDFFDPDRPIAYKIAVRDEEDGTSDEEEYEAGDSEFLDPEAPSRVTLSVSRLTGGAQGESHGPPGMRLMKASDCFNCHAIDQKRVGPPLLDVANKYRDQPHALPESVKRVRSGSSGVWGKVPMTPHTQHTDEELHDMVAWIYSLKADDAMRVFQGFVGEVPPAGTSVPSASVALEAAYADRGAAGIPPLTASTRVVLRTRHVEAEDANELYGTRILPSVSSGGQKFLGCIDHGHYVRFAKVPLGGVGGIKARVASAGAGGQIEVRLDKPDGPKLATLDVKFSKEWENWYDVTATIEKVSGVHDVFLVFVNPANRSALMNLDSIYFLP